METRAPYVLIGAFVLTAILAVFGFVYWLNNAGGIGPRTAYHVQFQGPVPGLLVGGGVLFNGIRVGEVTALGLAPDNPRIVNATIAVASTTPVRADTRVGLEFQGLRAGGNAGRRHDRREVGRTPDLACRGERRPEHDAGGARRIAAGQ
ncbi:phospholipid/cholesterol/gamma-HCH transport system substrate-binding protein [Bradyrhizobium sp. Gha]|nr:phospholipid/cholesterol/gamma-HCH transport system substrate-binding protein [Bradyrhizobium sp. Gha]